VAQAISRHPFIDNALVQSQAIPYGIIGNQSGTEAVLPEYFCFTHHYHNTDSPQPFVHLIWGVLFKILYIGTF
jgi:hypothetical protein